MILQIIRWDSIHRLRFPTVGENTSRCTFVLRKLCFKIFSHSLFYLSTFLPLFSDNLVVLATSTSIQVDKYTYSINKASRNLLCNSSVETTLPHKYTGITSLLRHQNVLRSMTYSATLYWPWIFAHSIVGHHDHPSSWIFRPEQSPRRFSLSRVYFQVFHVYFTTLYHLFLRLQDLIGSSSHTRL